MVGLENAASIEGPDVSSRMSVCLEPGSGGEVCGLAGEECHFDDGSGRGQGEDPPTPSFPLERPERGGPNERF